MVWLAYLGLSGSILFAISCATLLMGAPPKVVVELAVSASSVMLAGAMFVNLCVVALRRATTELDSDSTTLFAILPSAARGESPAPAIKSPAKHILADLPRAGRQARPAPPQHERRTATRSLPPSVVLQAARQAARG